VIRNHPAIGQIHVILELDRQHLRVDLYDRSLQPIANPIPAQLMIAIYFDQVSHVIGFFPVWR
jgi:hypothetical protein